VERALQRVLHGERAALDEEQVRQLGVAEHPAEGRHELGEVGGVDVGVRRLVRGDAAQLGEELRVVPERVDPQRGGREERVEVQVPAAGPGGYDPGPRAALQVEHEVESVDEQMPVEHLVHLAGSDPFHSPSSSDASIFSLIPCYPQEVLSLKVRYRRRYFAFVTFAKPGGRAVGAACATAWD